MVKAAEPILFQPFTAPPLAVTQHAIRLTAPLGLSHKSLRRGGVELEHLVVARNHHPRADGVGQRRGFDAVEVARHASLRRAAVDRQEGYVYVPGA